MRINLDIFETALEIYVGEDGKKRFENITGHEISDYSEGVFAMNEVLDNGIIWIENYDPATFAHEAVHYIIDLLDRKNIPINKENTEVFAYLMSYLVREFRGFADSVQKPKRK